MRGFGRVSYTSQSPLDSFVQAVPVAAGPEGFWRRALDIVLGGEGLEEGSCAGPFTLEDVARRIGVESYSAPRLVSIDTLSGLPQALRSRGLYVVRLGQYHEGRVGARFVLCRAEGGIQSAGIGLEDIHLLAGRSLLRVGLPPGLRAVMRLLNSSEAAGVPRRRSWWRPWRIGEGLCVS